MSGQFVEVEPLLTREGVEAHIKSAYVATVYGEQIVVMGHDWYGYAEARALRDWLSRALGDTTREDLLAALQTIAQQGAREEPDHEPWTGNADDSYDNGYERAKYHVAKIARAAIAKATGETP